MKANAKKLLALIMAFAMVMSLAAPAMAAGVDTAAEVSLSVQDILVTGIATNSDITTGFYIVVGGQAKNYKWTDASDEYVKIDMEGSENALFSGKNKVKYIATVKDGKYSESIKNDKSVSYEKNIDQKPLKDAAWAEIPAEATTVVEGGQSKTRKGYYAKELLPDAATYAYAFRLVPVESGDFVSNPSKYVYGYATVKEDLSGANLSKALFSATMTEQPVGGFTTTGITNNYKDWGSMDVESMATVSANALTTTYSFTAAGATNVTVTTDGVATLDTDVTEGKASVMATYTDLGETKTVSDAALMKSLLKTKGCTITSIAKNASDSRFFDVVFTATSAVSSDRTGTTVDKTSYYVVDSSKLVGLTDTAVTGIYNNKKGEEKSIPAGEMVYGPVVVTNDVANVSVKKGDVFESYQELVATATNLTCKEAKTIEYKQLIMNKKVNGVENTGVIAVTGQANTYKAVTGWEKLTDAQTTTGSLVLAPSANHFWREKTITKNKTCAEDGSVTKVTSCDVCGTEKEGTKQVTVVPKDTTEPLKTTKELGWVLKEKYSTTVDATTGKSEWDKVPATLASYYTLAGSDRVRNDAALSGKHYLAKAVTSNIVPGTKDKAGSYTVTYYCNYDVAHFTETREFDKEALEHSGRWDNISWSIQNTSLATDPSNMFGFRATVADTDLEYPELAIDVDGVADTLYFSSFTYDAATKTYNDSDVVTGIDVVSKDANGKKTSRKADFYATATIKDIKLGEKDCQDGSATIEINVYEMKLGADTSTLEKIAKSIKEGTLVAVSTGTFTKAYTIPALKSHIDANNDGKCDNCSAEINQTTTDNENTVDISKAVVTFKAMTYTGKVAQPTVTVTLDGVTLAKGVDYEVEELQAVNAGTYPLVVKGKGDFSGRAVGNVTIKKAKNPIKVAKTSVSVKAKDVKKKAKTIALKVTKAQGKVTVKSSKKKVVSWKSNKATVAKGSKKGTYKLTFTAKGNKNYKKGTKTVKVVVK